MARLIDPFSKNWSPDEAAAPDIDAAFYAASAAVDHQRGETHFYQAAGGGLPTPHGWTAPFASPRRGCPAAEPYPKPAPRMRALI